MTSNKSLFVAAALSTLTITAVARAQSAPADVSVVNVVDTNVVNIPDVKIVNTPTTTAIPPADSAPVVVTQDGVPLNNYLTTDVTFSNLVTAVDERLILDYVSVESYVAPNQRAWAVLLPCTEKGNAGRISLPMLLGGSVYSGDSKVNDAFLSNTAMHGVVEKGCTTVVRVFRGGTAGLGHATVTLQGHRAKKSFNIVLGQ